MIKFGKVANTHGLKGHVKILSNSDFKEIRLQKGANLWIVNELTNQETKVTVETWGHHKGFELVKFKEFNNINFVEQFKNDNVYCHELVDKDLEEDNYLHSDLIGCVLFDTDGNELGKVAKISDFGSGELLTFYVNYEMKLIPFVENFVEDVDIENKKIVVKLIEGLI